MAQRVVYELRKLDDVPALADGEGILLQGDALTAVALATLDDTGKVPAEQLPAIVITNTYTVASQAAMLVLDAHLGDVAIRTDEGKTYILGSDDPTQIGNWHQLEFAEAVTSVAGKTGTVALVEADVQGLVTDLAAKETPAGAQAKATAAQTAATAAAATDATTKANAAQAAAESYTDTAVATEEAARSAADAALAASKLDASAIDTDSTFAANSDARVPSQRAVKTAIANSGAVPALDGGGATSVFPPTPVIDGGDVHGD